MSDALLAMDCPHRYSSQGDLLLVDVGGMHGMPDF
jgi:hypothetical protein